MKGDRARSVGPRRIYATSAAGVYFWRVRASRRGTNEDERPKKVTVALMEPFTCSCYESGCRYGCRIILLAPFEPGTTIRVAGAKQSLPIARVVQVQLPRRGNARDQHCQRSSAPYAISRIRFRQDRRGLGSAEVNRKVTQVIILKTLRSARRGNRVVTDCRVRTHRGLRDRETSHALALALGAEREFGDQLPCGLTRSFPADMVELLAHSKAKILAGTP